MQDVLGLASEARMNTPGVAAGNWGWRFDWSNVPSDAAARLADATRSAGR
jgi:4-alpha-glucanotransferase